ncbi:aspartate/glutamate racemase family protein [Ramlibacter sp. Leaf400]|uniref:arylmalonate decarboxylase n=1 Tax=Ramlibacter sp. Leaf400 TaxID=1736365 RepID=UPI0006F2635B|nr:aspartate/glutamate racemase family protein [Ramlibacter sp. Leaf400]KQT14181.1 arylmalonate decarboxylase [Ramlibacter sp. Leaf400]
MKSGIPTVGLIVPPGHGKVPQDGPMLYGDRVRFIARGLGIAGVSPEGFAPVIDTVLDRARELRQAGAEVISLMGTSISFYRGPEFTESLRASMQEATGVPCTTMSHAIVSALKELGIRRVAVATSYIDELNDKLVAYLTHAGFTVTAIQGMAITGVREVGEVTTEALVRLSHEVVARDRSADGVFISCGGLLTLDAIRQLERELGLPVTASSPAGFWDVVRLAGVPPGSPGFGRLFQDFSGS